MRPRPLVAILLTLVPSAAACQLVWSYDDFRDQSGTGGHAQSSSSSSGGGEDSKASSSSSSSGGGGSGGGDASASSSDGGSSCTIDDDQDHSPSWKCDVTDSTLDCADEDPRASPGADFEASPITGAMRPGTLPWDFDCDGTITQETPLLYCGGFVLCGGSGFQPTGTTPECGVAYAVGHCSPTGFLGACQWHANNPPVMRVQRCK